MNAKRPVSLLIGGLLILLLSQWFNHAQAMASSERALTQAYTSRYLVPARDLTLAVERGLGLGKPLSLYSGTDRLFQDRLAKSPGISFMGIGQIDGTILYALDPKAVGKIQAGFKDLGSFPEKPSPESGNNYQVIQTSEMILLVLPVYFNQERLDGLTWVGFSKVELKTQLDEQNFQGLLVVLVSQAAAFLLFILIFYLLSRKFESNPGVEKKFLPRLTVSIAGIMLLSLGAYTVATNQAFTRTLLGLYQGNVGVLVSSVETDMQRLMDLGLEPEQLRGSEGLLARQIRDAPEVQELLLCRIDGSILYSADRNKTFRHREYQAGKTSELPAVKVDLGSSVYQVRKSLAAKSGQIMILTGQVDSGYLNSLSWERILDALTISLVSIVFSVELLLALKLLTGLFSRKLLKPAVTLSPESEARSLKVIRFTAFLFFLAELLPLPFLPLFISDLTTHSPVTVLNLSSEAMNSLPFSSHLLGVMVFIPIAGFLSERFNLKSLFLLCTGLLFAGNLLAAAAPDWTTLMIFRLVSGLGYGGILAVSAGLVITSTSRDNRATGFGQWSAGFAAASICAVALGGVIVSNFGYRVGLVTSAGLSIFLGIFIFFYHPNARPDPRQERARFHFSDLIAPFKERSIVAALLFASIPAQIAFFGLFQYTLPLTMNQAGISQANIGRILTVYGLLSLATPVIARMSDRIKNERIFIILGNLLTGGVLMFFFLQSGVFSMIFTVAAIGIGGMMVDAVMESYLSMAKESERIGETKFLSVFSTWEKLFTIFIPVLAGSLMSIFGYIQSAAVMGGIIVACTLLFLLFSRNLHKNPPTPEEQHD